MLCEDVRNVILEFAADRQFYSLFTEFADEIELHIEAKLKLCEEFHNSSYVDDILQDLFKEFGVTNSEADSWTTAEHDIELKFMILRKMPFEMSQKHYEWMGRQAIPALCASSPLREFVR